LPSVTEKDRVDIATAVRLGADILFASFVQSADMVGGWVGGGGMGGVGWAPTSCLRPSCSRPTWWVVGGRGDGIAWLADLLSRLTWWVARSAPWGTSGHMQREGVSWARAQVRDIRSIAGAGVQIISKIENQAGR
jgi:hypothetical protein